MTMTAADVVEILGWLGAASVDVWLDGGWGVDALVGEQTREHDDLDLIVRDAHEPRMREALATHGFMQVAQDPAQNFILADERGREVDVHPVRFDNRGNGHLLARVVSHSDTRLRRSRRRGAFPDTAPRAFPPKRRCRTIRGDTNRATPMSTIWGFFTSAWERHSRGRTNRCDPVHFEEDGRFGRCSSACCRTPTAIGRAG